MISEHKHPSVLSFAQQRLWFLDQLRPGQALYNIPVALRLRGPLNLDALSHAMLQVLRRHHVLRTRYFSCDGQPWQELMPCPKSFPLPASNLESEDELRRCLQQEARRPFNLSQDCMLRACLFRLQPDLHVLFVNMHHIASDAFSFEIFFRELSAFYNSFPSPAPIPELPLQYAAYAASQRQNLAPAKLQADIDFWKAQLADAPEMLPLPADRPRPANPSGRGDIRSLALPPDLAATLQQISRREKVTPFMFFLAAFKLLLFRLTHQDDILVGVPITGRHRPGTEQLIGFFNNTLVLRSRPRPPATFREYLQQVRGATLGAYTHHELPFERLIEELRLDRGAGQTPLVQVMFELQAAWGAGLTLQGLETGLEILSTGTSKFDITLAVTVGAKAAFSEIEYNTDLFDAVTIDRWLGHFHVLLAGIAENPDCSLSQLPLLTQPERKQILVDWNETQSDFPRDRAVHQLFERQAGERPDAVALASDGRQLTYGELNARANQLAHHLRALGVGPETLVGVCAERNLEPLVGILAILKAGGAFLPMDPSDPADRLDFMLADARAPVILTTEKFRTRFAGKANVLCLDTFDPAPYPSDNLPPLGDSENLAYVIYTSGSTGKSKGVEILRRSLVNHNVSMRRLYELSPADRVLQFASLSFDFSIEEIWPSLISGAAVVLRTDEALASVPHFLRFVERERITVLNLPTAFWHALVDSFPAPIPDCVRLVVVGGEKACAQHFLAWKRHVGSRIRLINTYGPTETTVSATAYITDAHPGGDLPIGRPIANTRAYILDSSLEPVPVGVVGELHIGGEGVARGYRDRPELTAQKFIRSPFIEGDRLYKTGDLARFLPDGQLDFVGRADYQVKIRGFRIELGEIEAQLRQHPAVRDAVVVARQDGTDSQFSSLAAWVVAPGASVAELREHLRQRVPHYMIPAAMTLLDKLPLTANGKVDRKALPALDATAFASEAVVEPRTETEKILAEIWRQLLGLPSVGIRDNFFRLGGHSLLGIRVISRIRDAFQLDLAMNSIFEAPTIESLAALIEGQLMREIEQLTDEQAALLARR